MSDLVNYIRQCVDEASTIERFNGDDILRINKQQWWLKNFLLAKDSGVESAKELLIDCLRWRMKFGTSEINHMELSDSLAENFIYFHGCDSNGYNLMWLNWSRYQFINTKQNAERLFVYWIERHTMETQNTSFTLLINFHGCDERDIDFEFSTFLFQCVNNYYPRSLFRILLYELPDAIKTSWRILLNGLVNVLPIFCVIDADKTSISRYIPLKYLPQSMGGEDDYVFVMHRLPFCIHSKTFSHKLLDKMESFEEDHLKVTTRKTVTFKNDPPMPLSSSGVAEESTITTTTNTHHLIDISPFDELVLQRNDRSEFVAEVVLKNQNLLHSQLFKVKTTAPQKFRVRPTLGVVKPNSHQIIQIVLDKAYEKTFSVERFLISTVLASSFDADADSLENFSQLFANAHPTETFQTKLNCTMEHYSAKGLQASTTESNETLNTSIENKSTLDRDLALLMAERELTFLKKINELRQQVNINRVIMILLIIFQAVSVLYFLKKTDEVGKRVVFRH